jgi:hypothetical protein
MEIQIESKENIRPNTTEEKKEELEEKLNKVPFEEKKVDARIPRKEEEKKPKEVTLQNCFELFRQKKKVKKSALNQNEHI